MFVAVCRIEPGEVLTANYLGYALEHALMSTPMRLRMLRNSKMFTCTCPKCKQQPDHARAMPCPRCHPSAASPGASAAGAPASAGDGGDLRHRAYSCCGALHKGAAEGGYAVCQVRSLCVCALAGFADLGLQIGVRQMDPTSCSCVTPAAVAAHLQPLQPQGCRAVG